MPLVAPFTGAWIEIGTAYKIEGDRYVAPFTGAWIEMTISLTISGRTRVAPFTGAWIEILTYRAGTANPGSRSLHGSVD